MASFEIWGGGGHLLEAHLDLKNKKFKTLIKILSLLNQFLKITNLQNELLQLSPSTSPFIAIII